MEIQKLLETKRRLQSFIGPQIWTYFGFSVAIGVLWFGIESSFLFVLQGFLLSIGLLTPSQVALPSWYPKSLEASVAILILFGLIRSTVYMMKTHFAGLTQFSFNRRIRTNLLTYGLRGGHAVSTKELVSIFTEITTQAGVVLYYCSLLVNTGIAAALFFVVGMTLAPLEMLMGVTLLALFLLPLRKLTAKINLYGKGLVQEWEQVNDALLRGLRNFFFLSLFKQIEPEIERGSINLKNSERYYTSYSLISAFSAAVPLLIGISVLSFLTYVSVQFIGTAPIKLLSFFYIFIRLSQSASDANSTLAQIKLNLPGFKVLMDWHRKLEAQSSQVKLPGVSIEASHVEVVVQNLGFGFSQGAEILRDLNFRLGAGDVLLIRGPSGSGKSTLLSLILGINKPTTGYVAINGHSTHEFELNLEKVLGYVGPEPFLISGSIRDNLLFGLSSDRHANDEDIWAALRTMEIDLVIRALPQGLGQPVHDIPQFSTGQRQRLAFARALLRKPRLLILDEATANLDDLTEARIIERLRSILPNITTIIVSHKSSFDEMATQRIFIGT